MTSDGLSGRLKVENQTTNKKMENCTVGARENYFFFDWGEVKIMRATFRGVHISVTNDNKNTLLDLVSKYNVL